MIQSIKLTFAGKEIEFSLGLGALGEILEKTDLSIDELKTKVERNPFKYFPILMYYSAECQCELDGKEIDFTLNDMIGFIDDSGAMASDQLSKFAVAFKDSQDRNVPQVKEIVEEAPANASAKKKLIGQTM